MCKQGDCIEDVKPAVDNSSPNPCDFTLSDCIIIVKGEPYLKLGNNSNLTEYLKKLISITKDLQYQINQLKEDV